MQTGKAQPGPIVLLDVPGGTYWQTWKRFAEDELLARNYISEHDMCLVRVTDDVDAAVDEITGFFSNYHSQRFVDGRLVLRMDKAPDEAALDRLNAEFSDIVARGRIERIDATPAEIADDDHVELERLGLRFDRHGWARLRELIDALNDRPSNH